MQEYHAALIKCEALRADDPAVFGPAWRELYAGAASNSAVPWWKTRRDELLRLAAEGSPRYVYDLATVRARARGLRGLRSVDRCWYAIKANSCADILRAVYAEGLGLECVSLAELEAARAAVPEIEPQQLLFTPNFAPREEYRAALAMAKNCWSGIPRCASSGRGAG